MAIPLIDLFAGPGGLSEGFTSLRRAKTDERYFDIAMSVEKDPFAVRTLRMRALFRELSDASGEYEKALKETIKLHLKGELSYEQIFEEEGVAPVTKKFKDKVDAVASHVKHMALGDASTTIDIKKTIESLGLRSKCIVIGGPPCQAYSLVGRSRMLGDRKREVFEKDQRHFLYREYLNVLKEAEPMAFVMENVKGLLSATVAEKSMFDAILKDLSGLNYQLFGLSGEEDISLSSRHKDEDSLPTKESLLLRAELYGVPQTRHRVIIVGIRKDLLESDKACAPQKLCVQKELVTVSDVIGGMPILRSGISDNADVAENWLRAVRKGINAAKEVPDLKASAERIELQMVKFWADKAEARGAQYLDVRSPRASKPLGKWLRGNITTRVIQHQTKAHMSSDLARYFFLSLYASKFGHTPTLKDAKEFPKSLWPDHQSVGKGFHDRFKVQLADNPATTITSHISKDGHYFIHPNPLQCRALTVREAARIQTFPDDYVFEGNRTQQYHQVGNAVPPFLARQIAEKLVTALGL